MTDNPFVSVQAYRKAFLDGLLKLLEESDMATFILAYANASMEPALLAAGRRRLHAIYTELANTCRHALGQGESPNAADDDILVFLKLMALGMDNLQPQAVRRIGPWEVQFNHLRSFRPRRAGGKSFATLREPFNPEGFHFDKPFLARETFWSGELHGRHAALLYNKFPIVEGHGLLVPEPSAHRAQYLEEHDHYWLAAIVDDLGRQLPGIGIAYNALGAYASINHLHFHLYLRDQPLPLAGAQWQHNGGATHYPAVCSRFDDPAPAWKYLHQLHEAQIPYHVIYLPGCIYCLPRRPQGSYEHSPWTIGYAWYEMAGGLTLFDKKHFERMDAEGITDELTRVTLKPVHG